MTEHNDDKTHTHVVLTKGTMVSHYQIVEKIGAGGMGEVYLAEDTELDRKIALKFLPLHLCQDDDYRTRFKREAQAVAKLNNPNIIHVYEVSEYQGQPFFAMELVVGQSIRDLTKDTDLDVDRIIELAIQICDGLSAAHDKKVVHRDIKPSNIVIDAYGRPKILDFGLAAIQGGDQLTKTGSTLGTVRYMSPEQVQGEEVDHRSDLFSLGVVIHELISGRTPFERDNEGATLKAIIQDNPEPLARYKSDISDELQRTVSKLLEKDPSMRYQTASGVLSDLKRLITPTQSSISGGSASKTSFPIRKVIVPALLVIVAVAVMVLRPWQFEVKPNQDAVASENRMSIMYFDNLADPADSLKLGEITANLLITDLSESQYVDVVSSQRLYDILKSMGREGEKKIDRNVATEIARKAKSRWMLLGSILQVEPSIIITSQMVEVETGSVISSQRIDGGIKDRIFSLVDKLTIEIKNDLSLPAQAMEEEDRSIMEVTTSSIEAYRYYLEGQENEDKMYRMEAENSFRKAIELDSTFAMAYYWLIDHVSGNEKTEARTNAMKYSDNVSHKEKLYIEANEQYYKSGGLARIKALKQIATIYPDEKNAVFWVGNEYRILGQIDSSLLYLKKAIELDSNFKQAYNVLAYVYNDAGDLDKSISAINKYIEIAPDEPNPYDSRGELYALNGKLEEAIDSYSKALEIHPNFVLSVRNLADLFLLTQQYEKAEDLYRRLVLHTDDFQRGQGRRCLARIPMHRGQFQEAIRVLENGIEADKMELGEGMSVAEKLWVLCMINGSILKQYDNAIADLQRAITIRQRNNPSDEFINHLMAAIARFYAAKGNYEMAQVTIDSIKYRIEQNESSVYNNYELAQAWVAFEKGDFESFIAIWRPLKESSFFAADYHTAVSYYNIGRIADAVGLFERAVSRYDYNRAVWPDLSVKAHYWLGKSYEASGWNDKAIEQYKTFLVIWKDADDGIDEVDDAKARLAKLRNNP